MLAAAYSSIERFCSRRELAVNIAAGVVMPPLTLYLFLIVGGYFNVSVELFACGGLFFAASAFFLLTGNPFRRLAYGFIVIQMPALYFLPLSFYATIICLPFIPLAFGAGKRQSEPAVPAFPNIAPLLLLLSGWMTALTYQTIAGIGDRYSLMFDAYLLLGLGIMYMTYHFLRLGRLDTGRLIQCIALSGAAFICFVLARYVFDDLAGMIFGDRFGTYVRVNPNIIASYLDMALPCAFFTAFFEKRNLLKKAFFYAVSLACACAVFMAATRASLPGIALIAAYAVWRRRSKRLLLAVSACVFIAASTVGATMIQRTLKPSAMEAVSNYGRMELLRVASDILEENRYFFGIGMNNFSHLKLDYGFPQWFDSGGVISSHNLYVDIWLGWGFLGLIGWLALNAAVVIPLVRKHRDNGAANAVVFAIAAYSIHGLFDCSIANYSIMFPYFLLLGGGSYIAAMPGHAPSDSSNRAADRGQLIA